MHLAPPALCLFYAFSHPIHITRMTDQCSPNTGCDYVWAVLMCIQTVFSLCVGPEGASHSAEHQGSDNSKERIRMHLNQEVIDDKVGNASVSSDE